MRNCLFNEIENKEDLSKTVFLTGDLGYGTLEKLKTKLGDRFINAGISEQNMISTAAGLSKQGFDVWIHSIAPFIYARAFEQIRNDICFHNLPVKMIGTGGGYTYGSMGPSHHGIEDYGVLLTLPNINIMVPAFKEDVKPMFEKVNTFTDVPVYFRMANCEKPEGFELPEYSAWRLLLNGSSENLICVGPIAGYYLNKYKNASIDQRPNIWVISEFSSELNIPIELLCKIKVNKLTVIEEHVSRGSFGSNLALQLLKIGVKPKSFKHLVAEKHIYNRYGSQNYLRNLSGLYNG